MTQYRQTVGKRTEWEERHMQTGLIPALPAVGSVLGGAGTAIGVGSILSRAAKGLKLAGKSGAKAARGGTGVTLAKAGIGTYALNEAVKFMNSGPQIAGVSILPAAVLGVIGIVGGNMLLP